MPTTIGQSGNHGLSAITVGASGNRTVKAVWGGAGGNRLLFAAINLNNQNISSESTSPAVAGYRLNAAGTAQSREQAVYTTLETWMLAGSGADYECRATVLSGGITAGTAGSWLSLGSDQEWSCSDNVANGTPVTASLLIEIRAASGAVLDSATINLSADRDSI